MACAWAIGSPPRIPDPRRVVTNLPVAPPWPPDGGSATDPTSVLAGLAELQRHLDVLGDDLVAADRVLDGWQGHARDRFHHHLRRDLQALEHVLAHLRRADLDVRDLLDRTSGPGATPW